jgi:hypothetical protein
MPGKNADVLIHPVPVFEAVIEAQLAATAARQAREQDAMAAAAQTRAAAIAPSLHTQTDSRLAGIEKARATRIFARRVGCGCGPSASG